MPAFKRTEDWAYLTGEERLGDWLSLHYGLVLQSIEPVGGVVRLDTDQGVYVLKRVRFGEKDRWQGIRELADFLSGKKDRKVIIPPPILTQGRKTFFEGYRYPYVLLPWIEGVTPTLTEAEVWRNLSRDMAYFHLSTKEFAPVKIMEKWNRLGNWHPWWSKVYEQMEIFHLAANWTSIPTETDETWLNISSYSMGIMENLLKYYEQIDGEKLCQESAAYGKVCHGRWHRNNLLIDPDGVTVLLDWNEAVLDVRTADIADWLLYAYGRTSSREVMKIILSGYQEVSPLTEGDYALIYARLLFPGRLIRHLQNVYLNQSKPRDSTIRHIRKAIEIEEKKIRVLSVYAQLVRNHFQQTFPEIDWIHEKGKHV
ncbi:phosphotransferase [Thermoactinomyces mirandus]|uniref:Phosphotransferase n=1 Tax=Thermoactinomyces mirandus TaxID=2756294 RepID=A0A7W1XT28_9BACL|nr:phosphotransferase [Thermoactinomyces mirandus]MBA4602759.1 phosphotransferase [Thermoactinomyces mirandus]